MRVEIDKAIGRDQKDYDRNSSRRRVLVISQIRVERPQLIKLTLRQGQYLAILSTGPTCLLNRQAFVAISHQKRS